MSVTGPTQRDACAHQADGTPVVERREWLLLAGVTLLGAALRIFGLARSSLWYDEGATMYVAELASKPLRLFDPNWLTEPPLVPLLVRAWMQTLGALGVDLAPGTYHADFLIRMVPCAFSIAAIPIGFGVARRLTGSAATGLIVSALIAIAPFHIFYAQELRPYATLTVFMLGAIWCLSKALETNRPAHWAGFTLLLTLAMYTHFFTIWYIASLGLAVCMVALKRGPSMKWIVSQMVLLVLIVPALKQGLIVYGVVSQIKNSWFPPLTPATGLITIKTCFAGYSPTAWAYYPLFALGMLLAGRGAWAMRRRGVSAVLLLVVGTVPIAGNLVVWSLGTFSYYEHRLFIVCGLLFFVLIASGFAATRSRAVRCVTAGLWIALTIPCLLDYYAQRIHPSEQHRLGMRYKVANRYVSNVVREGLRDGDVVGHFSHVTHFPLKFHYLSNATHVTLGFTDDDRQGMLASYPHLSFWEHFSGLPVRIDTAASQYSRMWYVESWWEPFNPPPWAFYYQAWLSRHSIIAMEKEYFGVRLSLCDFAAMRDSQTHIEQVVDAGDFSVPRYIDGRGMAIGQPPNVQLREPFALALERNVETGTFTIHNRSGDARNVQCRYFECAEAIEPLSFNRAQPETDVWRPIVHGNPNFFDYLDRIKMGASLARGRRETGSLFADFRLNKGTYRIYAYLWREVGPVNSSRATLQFNIESKSTDGSGGNGVALGEVTPWAARDDAGWSWFTVGDIESDGNTQRLQVTAHLPAELDSAFADLGRVAFVSAAWSEEASPVEPALTNTFTVGAGESKPFGLPTQPKWAGRYDMFVEDKTTRDVRFVNWYVVHP